MELDNKVEKQNIYFTSVNNKCPHCGKDTGYDSLRSEVITYTKTCPHCGKVIAQPLNIDC